MNKIISPRKIKILELIIELYIETAEPVGSRTISKKYNLGLSPATIRNEMSDLEDMGYIIQPYTSAGRIPSDKGYRLYVDNLMEHKKLNEYEINFLQKIIINNVNQIDYLIKETAKAISILTNYTTIMTEPTINELKIKLLKFIAIDQKTLILVLVTSDNNAKNFTIKTNVPKNLDDISNVINKKLKGLSLNNINPYIQNKIMNVLGIKNEKFMHKILNVINSIDDNQIYTSGIKNILAFPEFCNLEKAKNIFEALEEQKLLKSIFKNKPNDDIEITIGNENQIDLLKDCSLIKTNCSINKIHANIGIIGPTRMNYSQVVSVLNAIENVICNSAQNN